MGRAAVQKHDFQVLRFTEQSGKSFGKSGAILEKKVLRISVPAEMKKDDPVLECADIVVDLPLIRCATPRNNTLMLLVKLFADTFPTNR